jgi:hypothetical protein
MTEEQMEIGPVQIAKYLGEQTRLAKQEKRDKDWYYIGETFENLWIGFPEYRNEIVDAFQKGYSPYIW